MPNSKLMQRLAAHRKRMAIRGERRQAKLEVKGYEFNELDCHSGGDRKRGIGLTAHQQKRDALARAARGEA